METKKNFFMLLVIVGIISAVVGLIRPIPAALRCRSLTSQMGEHYREYERDSSVKLSLHKYVDAGSSRDYSERRLCKLTDQAHTIALAGLLLTACGLTGLWMCTNRELKNIRNSQQRTGE
jgi:hypothetical protein